MQQRGAERRRSSRVIERQLKQLMRLVDDLLDVSRITRGKVELHKERVVDRRGRETRRRDHAAAASSSADSRSTLDVPGDLFVDGDPTRLQQVFANLLTNASKYSDPGTGVRVSAQARRRPRRDPRSRPRDRHPPRDARARVRPVRAAAAVARPLRRWASVSASRSSRTSWPRTAARFVSESAGPGHGQRVHRDPAFAAGGGRRRAPPRPRERRRQRRRIPGLQRARRRRQRGRCRDARGLARVDGPRRARRARRPGGPRRGRQVFHPDVAAARHRPPCNERLRAGRAPARAARAGATSASSPSPATVAAAIAPRRGPRASPTTSSSP